MSLRIAGYVIGILAILIAAACGTDGEPNVTLVGTLAPTLTPAPTSTPTPHVVPVSTVASAATAIPSPSPTPTRLALTTTPTSLPPTPEATATPVSSPTASTPMPTTPAPTATTPAPTATTPAPTPTTPAPTPTTPAPTATTPAPTPTTPAPTPEPVLGSRQNPVPLGTTVEIKNEDPMDHWEVTVVSATPNATKIVLDENPYNDPPEDEKQFFIVTVKAKYLGPDSTQFDGSFRLRALGDSGVVYTTFEDSCGVIPNELPDPELFTNGTVEGAECWQIATGDADSLVMLLEPALFSFDDARAWFSLKVSSSGSAPAPTPTTSAPTPTTPALTPTQEPALGSRQNPVPLGTTVEIKNEDPMDHWEVTVVSATPNATKIVLDENPYNDPPEDEKQFFIVTVKAKYLGPDSTQFDGSFRLRALGDSGVVYTTFEDSCGVIPNELPDPELFTNGTVEGAECWQIATGDADSLVMLLEPALFSFDDARAWFSLKVSSSGSAS